MANMLQPIIAMLVIAAVAFLYLGVTTPLLGISFLSAVLFGAAIVMLLKWGKVKFAQGMPPKSRQTAGIIGVVVLVALFAMGALSGLTGTLPAGSLTNIAPGAVTTGQTASSCKASVNAEIVGKAATLTLNGYDFESSTPYSSTVPALVYVFKNGAYVGTQDTAGHTVTALAVGDVVDIYGQSNASYYVEDVLGVCITGEQTVQEVKAHAAITQSGVKTTCYASDGTVLNAGATSLADYNVTQGANEKTPVSCIVKANTANKAFWLKGVATAVSNHSKQAIVTDSQWSPAVVPTFLSTTVLQYNETATCIQNFTGGYSKVFTVSSPIKLSQWQQTTVNFELDSGTSDPTFNSLVTGANNPSDYFIQFLDEGSGRDASGAVYNDIATRDTTGSKLGITMDVFSPLGKTTGTIIQAI